MLGLRRPLRRKQFLALAVASTVVLMTGYIMLLNHEEHLMEAYYHNLRQTEPELYLSKIMHARGFRKFIDEYLTIHDYSHPITTVPPFLIGRWVLFDSSKHVSDDFIPDSCLSGVEIEDGRVKFFGTKPAEHAARYTMTGNTITAHMDDGSATEIDVIGYGSRLHHIEIKNQGSDQVQYGYMCR